MAATGGTRNSSRLGGQGGPHGGGDSWAKCQMAAQAMIVPEHVGRTPWFASKVGQSASPTEPRKVGWRGRTSSTGPVLHRVSVSHLKDVIVDPLFCPHTFSLVLLWGSVSKCDPHPLPVFLPSFPDECSFQISPFHQTFMYFFKI